MVVIFELKQNLSPVMDEFLHDWSASGKSFLIDLVLGHAKLLGEINSVLSKRKSEAEASNPNKKRRSGGLRGPHFDWNQSTWGKNAVGSNDTNCIHERRAIISSKISNSFSFVSTSGDNVL